LKFSFFSVSYMVKKKVKKKSKLEEIKKTNEKTETKKSKPKQKKNKENELSSTEIGIVVIDDELKEDKESEFEERKAYLEEARSQETSD